MNLLNLVTAEIEEAIVTLVTKQLVFGQVRFSNELSRYGYQPLRTLHHSSIISNPWIRFDEYLNRFEGSNNSLSNELDEFY